MSAFQALGLPESLCRILTENNLLEPTAVQAGAIPIALEGRDVISSARTGSGKTLAYCLPTLVRLSANKNSCALVLVPTREIAVQVQSVLQPYLRAMGMSPAALIIGGVSMGPQIQNLRRNPHVIVATPGRLNDHLRGGRNKLENVTTLVLDEADRMLDMGFLPQVKQILQHISKTRQTLLFSATMPGELKKICDALMNDPARVAVDAPNTANVDVEQRMIEVSSDGKQDALLEALKNETESVLVFARTKRRTDRVAQYLEGYGIRVDRIHGDRSQGQRQKAIDGFRSGRVKVLVATDIAGRGLDIPSVALVINFDLPEMREDYVHRIGRTGRAGEKGIALSFVAPEDRGHWASITGQKKEGAPAGRSRAQPQRGQQRSFSRNDQRPQRGDSRPTGAGPAPARTSRFKPWGAPRAERADRPERTEQAPRENRGSRPEFAPRTRTEQRERSAFGGEARREPGAFGTGTPRGPRPNEGFDGRQREARPEGTTPRSKPAFGGHGRSAPPAMAGARGRWKARPNREQPSSN
jgi:superfamily II DNA/RNA helicase